MVMPPEKSSYEPTVGRLRDLSLSHKDIRCRHEVIPDATSHHLGWVGLQAIRYRDLATNEIHIPALAQQDNLLVLYTKPPSEAYFRCGEVKREIPAPVGSITVIPVGSAVDCRWRGTQDRFHIHLDPKLLTRVATATFELDLSRIAVPPLDALILPELRATMLAVDAELTSGGLGGPL